MATKRPANGCNFANRRSNMNGRSKKWKEQLVQGVKEGERKEAQQMRIDQEVKYRQDQKKQFKMEARQADIEHGFVDASIVSTSTEIPEWKKYKIFLRRAFPPPTVCRKMEGEMVFKNKQCMQEYLHRVVSAEEWEANVARLAALRAELEVEKSVEAVDNQQQCMESNSGHHSDVDRDSSVLINA